RFAGVCRLAEQPLLGTATFAAFADGRNLPKQIRFNWLNIRELDPVFFLPANYHLIELSPASPAAGSRAIAGHRTRPAHGRPSKRWSALCNGLPACGVALSPSSSQKRAGKPSCLNSSCFLDRRALQRSMEFQSIFRPSFQQRF